MVLTMLVLMAAGYYIYHIVQEKAYNEIKVLLAFNRSLTNDYPYSLAAYESILEEEGIPYQKIDLFELTTLPRGAIARKPAIIFPDGINQIIPREIIPWIKDYLGNGGNIFLVSDVGVKNLQGVFHEEAFLTDIIGINYITYKKNKSDAYTQGYITINGQQGSDFLEIPPGKTGKDFIVKGYKISRMTYPMARVEKVKNIGSEKVFANITSSDGKIYPAFALYSSGGGNIFYANPPLGYLKGQSDELFLRSALRAFLLKVVGVPRILPVPNNKGGIVINWHIDSSIEWSNLPKVIADGFFRKGIKCSSHITAGDFLDIPGDGLGFDAGGKGHALVEKLKEYGVIGSHGGWGHNWFAKNIEEKKFNRTDMEKNIRLNKESLEKITGYRIIEYSAPAGVHPQPVTTKILEKLGFIAYYYTGDASSAPNRSFYKGQMVSQKMIAFPISLLEEYASFYEMKNAGKTEQEVGEWLSGILNFVARNKTVRLIYSHPYNIKEYPLAIHSFLDRLEDMQAKGSIQVETMSYFTKHLTKVINTRFSFRMDSGKMIVRLINKEGLHGITVAVPKKGIVKPVEADSSISIDEDEHNYYLTVQDNSHEKTIDLRTS